MLKKLSRKINQIKAAILLEEGVDPEYDKACLASFNKFLDAGIYFFQGLYLVVALISFYFFTTKVLI